MQSAPRLPHFVHSPPITRRHALKSAVAIGAGLSLGLTRSRAGDAAAKVEQAHTELWRRFIDPYGILVDYADKDGGFPRPTPEECRAGKPNALGWWSPIENGSMFNGMYLDGVIQRWKWTRADQDKQKARRLAQGLLLLSSLGPPGFIARGVATDGRTPYPMGSDDQTGPWLYGLWRYVHEGLADLPERAQIIAQFSEVATVIEANGWKLPCNEGAPSPFRGSFAAHSWQCAPRLLFLLKAAHALTGDEHWAERYREAAREVGGPSGRTRVQICASGMVFHNPQWRESWTGASSVITLRGLWEMETDPAWKQSYADGLAASLKVAADGVPLATKFDNESSAAFLHDWRKLNEWWQPQSSEAEALAVAERESKELGRLSPRRYEEFVYMREPIFAAWVVTLCPDRALVEPHRGAILDTLAHYDYTRIRYSQFFPAEAAWFPPPGADGSVARRTPIASLTIFPAHPISPA